MCVEGRMSWSWCSIFMKIVFWTWSRKSLFLIFLLCFFFLFYFTHIPFPGDAFSTEDLPTIPGIRVWRAAKRLSSQHLEGEVNFPRVQSAINEDASDISSHSHILLIITGPLNRTNQWCKAAMSYFYLFSFHIRFCTYLHVLARSSLKTGLF